MKARSLLTGTALALAGWFALAPANMLKAAALPGNQVAQNEWNQGQRGQSHHEKQPNPGRYLGSNKQDHDGDRDEWYQGQRGHWYHESTRWQWRADSGYNKGSRSYYGSAQGQHRQALINQDRRLRQQYKAAYARDDKNAQKRSMELLRETDRQFGMTEQQINAGVLPY